MKSLIKQLYTINAIKFGTFTLKSGIESPIYLDLRVIVSYPKLLNELSEAIWKQISSCTFDNICGVPYTALPIATAISLNHQVPMVMRRKEVKSYGTKKAIEGSFNKGERTLIIEDLVTSGGSVLETVDPLKEVGLDVTDVAVLIDRQQGGEERLEQAGLKLHAVMTISEILDTLVETECITKDTQEQVNQFLLQTQV